MSPLDRFIAALKARGLRYLRSGEGWKAQCPAHDDRNPSLTFRELPSGTLWITCWAGCEKEEVLRSLGLEWPDLFVDS